MNASRQLAAASPAKTRELARRLTQAEDRIADLEDAIDADKDLVDACQARNLWSAEDVDKALPMPGEVEAAQ